MRGFCGDEAGEWKPCVCRCGGQDGHVPVRVLSRTRLPSNTSTHTHTLRTHTLSSTHPPTHPPTHSHAHALTRTPPRPHATPLPTPPPPGELIFLGYSFSGQPYVSAGVLDAHGNLSRQWGVELPWPVMMHDMVATQRYVVLMHLPLCFDPEVRRRSCVCLRVCVCVCV